MQPKHTKESNSDQSGHDRQVVDQVGRNARLQLRISGSETKRRSDNKSDPNRRSVETTKPPTTGIKCCSYLSSCAVFRRWVRFGQGLKTTIDWPSIGSLAVKVTDPTRLAMPDNVHVVPAHVPSTPSKVPNRESGPVTIAVHVRPWFVDSLVSTSVGIVVVVVVVDVVVVVLVDVVVDVVDELVVVVPSDDTTKPRSLVSRSDACATLNSVEADVSSSLGPAMPDWKVYPHEFTENTGAT